MEMTITRSALTSIHHGCSAILGLRDRIRFLYIFFDRIVYARPAQLASVQRLLTTQICLSRVACFRCCSYHLYGETSGDRGKVKNYRYLFTCVLKHLIVVF